MTHHKAARNPAGVATNRPIALRLMPNELQDAARIAARDGLSLAAHSRQCYLLGKNVLLSENPYLAPPTRRKRAA